MRYTGLLAGLLVLSTQMYGADTQTLSDEWRGRVIPCPKTCTVAAAHPAAPETVALILPEGADPKYDNIRSLLTPFARGTVSDTAPAIVFALRDTNPALPEDVAKVFDTVPNSDQAYVIVPRKNADAFTGLLVCAKTNLGLLYGARTLSQMFEAEPGVLPELALTDWPDMLERGQWGGSSTADLAWLAARKFNVVEAHASLTCDDTGKGIGSLPEAMRAEAVREGINLVPIILHLEQIFTNNTLRQRLPGLASTPDPSKPTPSDYVPGICFSNPDAIRLLGDWMESLASLPEVTDINLWLSEGASPCFCPACNGKEPFALEVAAAVKAFERAKAVKPCVALRLLLTQGSYPVNDVVLAAAPPEVKITYYHGGLTYDSSANPMIYPSLEKFAASGRWLGVYPQVTNAWRTITPFTGPQFIRTRMTEFIDKKLSNVITYAVPSNQLHDFNVTAAAEWLWNNKGRDETAYSRAWARAHNIADPDTFAQWAVAVGPVGWRLAGSRTAISLINETGAAYMKGDHPFTFGEWILSGIASQEEMTSLKRQATDALDLAVALGYGPAIAESRIHQAFLNLADGLRVLSQAPAQPAPEKAVLYQSAFEQADTAARILDVEHAAWAHEIAPGQAHARLLDTMASGFRAVCPAAGVLQRLNIPDPDPTLRSKKVGAWTDADFAKDCTTAVVADLADTWYGPGPYVLTFEYHGGLHGIYITKFDYIAVAPDGAETVLGEFTVGSETHVNEPWREVRFQFPKIPPHTIPRIRIGMHLLQEVPLEQRVSKGDILLRRGLSEY